MNTENNMPTPEEIEQFILLRDKIYKYENQILSEQEKLEKEFFAQQVSYSGVVPHQLNITVTTDVYQIQNSEKIAPILLEKFTQNYIIDFLDNSYGPLVSSIYDNMTKTLEASCVSLNKENENNQ